MPRPATEDARRMQCTHELPVPFGERDRLGRGVRRPAEHGLNRADGVSLGEDASPDRIGKTVALPERADNFGMRPDA